ncbi:uncharacterized protein LOC132560181 [Ylistrum balloti]|uniref:uncharacterized protein LOC132560181 n=1 Tax=Ylistrum balloti TaxID=509963 RepID=UPI002905F1C3|nr:uncharacterized protein LOC132560181 [Ylistrum balloti]
MASVNEEAVAAHNELAFKLQQELSDSEINELKYQFRDCPLSRRHITNIKDIDDLFVHLGNAEKLSIGNYEHFTPKLRLINPRMATYVEEQEKIVKGILNGGAAGPSAAKKLKSSDTSQQQSTACQHVCLAWGSSTSTSPSKEIQSDLRPLIVQTINRIKTEKEEKKFMETKAFHDAQEKLRENRVIMIKGNTGDGKTSTAIQLMDWLIKEQQCRQPLQLHEIKKLDKLSPDSNLVTFIDDIFGEKNVRNTDVCEWNKRINNVKTLFVDQRINPNFLLVTIRNEIYNDLKRQSLEPVFTKDTCNIIDLSSETYRILEERKELLQKYLPNNYKWEEEEIESIVKSASSIGFPQCCHLFYNSVELQAKRVNFFEKPFEFLNEVLSRLPECCAILFLFLNGGMINVKDLDPNSDKINKTLLEESFDINLIDGEEDRTSLTYKKKVGFVKESLDRLLGFLVVKEENWSGDEVYRFNHDSVHVTVALLYWNKTPVGYIQNCPVKSLGYLKTSKTSSDMIVISSDHYTCLCERLLREFECYHSNTIRSLDVWKYPVFVVRFVGLLNERKVDKRAVLNKACKYGVKECVLYLLSVGVKPDKYTNWWSLITGGDVCGKGDGDVDVLKEVIKYLNDEMKHDLLNAACMSGSTECGIYLLSVGAKPDNDTNWWLLTTGGDVFGYRGKGDVNVLKEVVKYLNDEMKHNLLNRACESGSTECVLNLLSVGAKPDNNTNWWPLIRGGDVFGKGDVDVLKEVVKYLNDEMKHYLLNNACMSGSTECGLYLLSVGAKPDNDTDWWSLITGGDDVDKGDVDVLKEVVKYLNDMKKHYLLNKACMSGSTECGLYLLSVGAKPDMYTNWWPLIRGGGVFGKGDVDVLKEVVKYLNDEMKLYLLNRAYDDDKGDMDVLKEVGKYLNDVKKHYLLNRACESGSTECGLYLLSVGVKPDKYTNWWSLITGRDVFGYRGKEDVVVLKGVVKYLNDEMKNDLLNRACESGSTECVLYLLNVGVKPDNETLLFVAAGGSVELLRKLLQYDVTITVRDEYNNNNVLHQACESGSEEMVTELCDKYPDLVRDTNKYGQTPLHVAAGIDLSIFQTVERTTLKTLYTHCGTDGHVVHRDCVWGQYMFNFVDNEGLTLIHASCERGNKEMCVYLCEKCPSLLTAVDNEGRTVLHASCERGNKEMCVYLCEKCPSLLTAVDNEGRTVLHASCARGDKEMCVYLCEKCPSLLTAVDNKGQTVLHASCYWGNKEMCVYLCEKCPSLLTTVDNRGRTVLHVSCEEGNEEICVYLCEQYPSLLTVFDKRDRRCLHYIAESDIQENKELFGTFRYDDSPTMSNVIIL